MTSAEFAGPTLTSLLVGPLWLVWNISPGWRALLGRRVALEETAHARVQRGLADHEKTGRRERSGSPSKLLRKPDASIARGLDAIEWGQTIDAVLSNQAAGTAAGFKLPTASLFSLRAAECIDVTVPSGLPDATDQGLVVRRTSVLPLGRAVLEVLYDELTGAEIESSVREPGPASGLR